MDEYLELLRAARYKAGNPSTRHLAERTSFSHTHIAVVFNGQNLGSPRCIEEIADVICKNDPEMRQRIIEAHMEKLVGKTAARYESLDGAEPQPTLPSDAELIAKAIRDGLGDIANAIREITSRR